MTSAEEPNTSGTCGKSAAWSYEETSKKLTISGTGEIDLWDNGNSGSGLVSKWRDEIETIEFQGNGFTAIGPKAFYNCNKLKSINIPDGVTSIGAEAFANCKLLEEIGVPASVSSVGQGAFRWCSSLTSVGAVNSGSSIEIAWDAIPAYAFEDCTSLKTVTIPESVKTIGINAFSRTAITELTIPVNVTKLATGIFDECDQLSKVIVFADHSALEDFDPQGYLHHQPLYNGKAWNDKHEVIPGCPLLTTVGPIDSDCNIQINWDMIPDHAFWDCIGLESVMIPDSVTEIGEYAFADCTALTDVNISNSVTAIDGSAFNGCSNLKEIDIPANVVRLQIDDQSTSDMFLDCTSLESINVDPENKVYSSQDGVLFSKEKTTLYRVPETKVNYAIPEGVTTIGTNAFYGCPGLTDITFPTSVTTLHSFALAGCADISKLIIPNHITSFSFMFDGCTSLTEVTLPGSADYYQISGPKISTVKILEGPEHLYNTFSGCPALTTVYLPASLTKIDINSFAGCSQLKTVYFAGTQAQWDSIEITSGNQELSLATIICTGTDENPPDNPENPRPPETLGVTASPGGLGQNFTVQVQAGHWLTTQTRRAGSIAISSIQAPAGMGRNVTVIFSAPAGSILQVWETEGEMTFENGVPTNKILKTVVKEL